jgi:hypothetical protein
LEDLADLAAQPQAYTVYMPRKTAAESTVLTLRVSPDLNRRLIGEARRRRRTRSAVAREILQAALTSVRSDDPAAEARRQSRLASRRPSEREALEFIAAHADLGTWR